VATKQIQNLFDGSEDNLETLMALRVCSLREK
jgi:hypothetical protein